MDEILSGELASVTDCAGDSLVLLGANGDLHELHFVVRTGNDVGWVLVSSLDLDRLAAAARVEEKACLAGRAFA